VGEAAAETGSSAGLEVAGGGFVPQMNRTKKMIARNKPRAIRGLRFMNLLLNQVKGMVLQVTGHLTEKRRVYTA
jgi:hypothetical protein